MSRGAIFILPTTISGALGPSAAWVSTAGWAAAARRELGQSWIITPDGLADEASVRRAAARPDIEVSSRWTQRLPVMAKTAVKDMRQFKRGRSFHVEPTGPWDNCDLAFVWQRHELFHKAGSNLAKAHGVPSVTFVPAPIIWESRQWGVKRPGWGRLLESVGERAMLNGVDVVACGSDAVAAELVRFGVKPSQVLVTPTGVDIEQFRPDIDGQEIRRQLGIEPDQLVVGWTGSFRRFHNLPLAIEAMAQIPEAVLLLVGDGPERPSILKLAEERGVRLISPGAIHHQQLPQYVAAMDIALVLGRDDQSFHYSPLKLAEFLAAGKPTNAPAVKQLNQRLDDGVNARLIPPGCLDQLVGAIREFRDSELRAEIGQNARKTAVSSWSWDNQIRQILAILN